MTDTSLEALEKELLGLQEEQKKRQAEGRTIADKENALSNDLGNKTEALRKQIEAIEKPIRKEMADLEANRTQLWKTLQAIAASITQKEGEIATLRLRDTGRTTEESIAALLKQTGVYEYGHLKILKGKEGVSDKYGDNSIKRKPDITTADKETIEQYAIDISGDKNVWLFFHRGRLIALSDRQQSQHIGDLTSPDTWIGERSGEGRLYIVVEQGWARKTGGPALETDAPIYYLGKKAANEGAYNSQCASYRKTVAYFKQLTGTKDIKTMDIKEALK